MDQRETVYRRGRFRQIFSTGKIETVLAGGENYLGSRPVRYEWVKKLHDQCEKYDVHLIFGQTGNVFIKEGKEYRIRNRTDQMVQALLSGLHYPPVDIEAEVQNVYETREKMKAARSKKIIHNIRGKNDATRSNYNTR